jgi:hypothetical protein
MNIFIFNKNKIMYNTQLKMNYVYSCISKMVGIYWTEYTHRDDDGKDCHLLTLHGFEGPNRLRFELTAYLDNDGSVLSIKLTFDMCFICHMDNIGTEMKFIKSLYSDCTSSFVESMKGTVTKYCEMPNARAKAQIRDMWL